MSNTPLELLFQTAQGTRFFRAIIVLLIVTYRHLLDEGKHCCWTNYIKNQINSMQLSFLGCLSCLSLLLKQRPVKKKKKKDSRNRSDKCASGIGSHRQPFRELPRAWGRSPLIGRGFPDSCDAGEGTSPGCSCKQLLSVFRALMDTRNARQCSPRNSHGIRIPSSCASQAPNVS